MSAAPLPRGATIGLWLSLLLYSGWLLHHAWSEVTTPVRAVGVEGQPLEPPRPVPEGTLIEPRPGGLLQEVVARYLGGGSSPQTPAWETLPSRLRALGLTVEPVDTSRSRSASRGGPFVPRLVRRGDSAWLVVGRFGARPVVFDPARGVLLLRDAHALDGRPALRLPGAREAPW